MLFIVENQSGEQIDWDDDVAVAKQKCDGRRDGFRVVRAIDGAVLAEMPRSQLVGEPPRARGVPLMQTLPPTWGSA